jgi:hypothetical protein
VCELLRAGQAAKPTARELGLCTGMSAHAAESESSELPMSGCSRSPDEQGPSVLREPSRVQAPAPVTNAAGLPRLPRSTTLTTPAGAVFAVP